MAALRYLGFLGLFVAGLVAVLVILTGLVEPRYVKLAGVLALAAYFFAFWVWTKPTQRDLDVPDYKDNSA